MYLTSLFVRLYHHIFWNSDCWHWNLITINISSLISDNTCTRCILLWHIREINILTRELVFLAMLLLCQSLLRSYVASRSVSTFIGDPPTCYTLLQHSDSGHLCDQSPSYPGLIRWSGHTGWTGSLPLGWVALWFNGQVCPLQEGMLWCSEEPTGLSFGTKLPEMGLCNIYKQD